MKKVVFTLISLLTAALACGEDKDNAPDPKIYSISDQTITGLHNSQAWTFVSGTVGESTLPDMLSIELYSETSTCDEPPEDSARIVFLVPNRVGRYPIDASNPLASFFAPPSNNTAATEGVIEVEVLTSSTAKIGLLLNAGEGFEINGRAEIFFCGASRDGMAQAGGIAGETKLNALTPEESQALCTTQIRGMLRNFLTIGFLEDNASLQNDSCLSIAQGSENCPTELIECVDSAERSTNTLLSSADIDSSCQTFHSQLQDCELTVGELNACFNRIDQESQGIIEALTCSSDLERFNTAAVNVTVPECQRFEDHCPGTASFGGNSEDAVEETIVETPGCSGAKTPPGTYFGRFECNQVETKDAQFVWNPETCDGIFGWSESENLAYLANIQTLAFSVTLQDVEGLSESGPETVLLEFDLTNLPPNENLFLSGPGSLTHEDGTVENCLAEFDAFVPL